MLIDIFCNFDDFCKLLDKEFNDKLIGPAKNSGRKPTLTLSEVMTISVYYQFSGFKNFKTYYLNHVQKTLKHEFPKQVSYNRFVELMGDAILPLMLFFQLFAKGECTGISIIDSFVLKVCHPKREYSHKVFKNIAKKGKTSVGWFYGFKVHFVINNCGEIIDIQLTPGNVADNDKIVAAAVTKNIFGKLLGDKGYIGLFKEFYERGIQLIHKIKSNMKNKLMDIWDKILLKKRGTIESVINVLKNTFNIEHTRHRSKTNFLVNIFSSLIAYNFKENKPSFAFLKLEN